jgi:outer membrane protein W
LGGTFANAQNGLDAYFGVGTTSVSASGTATDTFGDGTLFATPKLGGAFGKAGADIMLTPHFGIGGEADFRFSQGAYAGLTYRPTFYDFNGIWHPIVRSKRVVPEFQAGIGAVNLKFFENQSFCDAFAGCQSSNAFLESSNHFQTHLSAAVRFYVNNHVFFRPQIDARYVDNFFQFGSNWVPEYSASIGYSFGER